MTSPPANTHPTPKPRPWWRRFLVPVALVYAVWLAIGCAVQRSVVFPRHMAAPSPQPGIDIPDLQMTWLETDQGKVEVWFAPGHGVSADHPGPAVIFAHGNAELIDDQGSMVYGYRKMGVSVLLVEYRGYGRSAGSPSQHHITQDLIAAYDQLIARPEVDANHIVFHGRSVGTGVACSLAAHRPPAALILRSPFLSVATMMAKFGIPRLFVLDPFDNLAVVQSFKGSVLVMHGNLDEVIPFAHGQQLAEAAERGTFVEFDSHHNDFPDSGSRHWEVVRDFLNQAEIIAPPTPAP